MENKKLLSKAVDDYEVYNISKRATLKTLINIAIHNEAVITPTELSKLTRLSRSIVYYNLKILESDNFITIKQPTVFMLNEYKMQLLIERHKNKNSLI